MEFGTPESLDTRLPENLFLPANQMWRGRGGEVAGLRFEACDSIMDAALPPFRIPNTLDIMSIIEGPFLHLSGGELSRLREQCRRSKLSPATTKMPESSTQTLVCRVQRGPMRIASQAAISSNSFSKRASAGKAQKGLRQRVLPYDRSNTA